MFIKLLLLSCLLLLYISPNLLAQDRPPEQPSKPRFWLDPTSGRLGLQLSDRFLLGGRADVLSPSSSNQPTSAVGAFGRYYSGRSNQRLRPYFQAELAGYPITSYEWQGAATAGLEYRLGQGTSLHTELSYQDFFGRESRNNRSDRWQFRLFLATRNLDFTDSRRGFKRGDVLVRSDFFQLDYYRRNTMSAPRNLNLTFHPEIYYALGPRWMVGGSLKATTNIGNPLLEGNFSNFELNAQAELRYFMTKNTSLRPYLAGGINYHMQTGSLALDREVDFSSFSAQLKAGLLVPLGNRTFIDIQLGIERDLSTGRTSFTPGIGIKIRF